MTRFLFWLLSTCPYLLQLIDRLLLGVKGHQGLLMLYLQLLLQLYSLMHMLERNREREMKDVI